MAISFTCGNPACRRQVHAPESSAGRRARCPYCGKVQTVPATGTINPAEAMSKVLVELEAPATRSCPRCGQMMKVTLQLCPSCSLPPSPPSNPLRHSDAETKPGTIGAMTMECLRAGRYGLSNFGSSMKLMFFSTVLMVLLLLVVGFAGCLGEVLGTIVSRLAILVMLGYYLRYCQDVVESSLEGSNEAPDLPPFHPRELCALGFRGLCIFIICVMPVVTLPMLPLSLLALCYTNDWRCLNVVWTARTAARNPRRLLALGGMLLGWIIVAIAAVIGVILGLRQVRQALGAEGNPNLVYATKAMMLYLLILVPAIFLLAGVIVMFMTVLFRCVGMLGRFAPSILDSIPEQDSPLLLVGYVTAGLVAGIALWTLAGHLL